MKVGDHIVVAASVDQYRREEGGAGGGIIAALVVDGKEVQECDDPDVVIVDRGPDYVERYMIVPMGADGMKKRIPTQ